MNGNLLPTFEVLEEQVALYIEKNKTLPLIIIDINYEVLIKCFIFQIILYL